MQDGVRYYYQLPEFEVNFFIANKQLVFGKYIIRLFSPLHCPQLKEDDFCFASVGTFSRYPSIQDNLGESFKPIFGDIRFYGKPNLRGLYKWRLIGHEDLGITVNDCADIVSCSIDTSVHPSKRKWFLEKNGGLGDFQRESLMWEFWSSYERKDFYVWPMVYYRLVAYVISSTLKEEGLKIVFSELKELIEQFVDLHNTCSFTKETMINMHNYFLRDVIKLWDSDPEMVL